MAQRVEAARLLSQAVLSLVAALPPGRATTYGAMAEHLDVSPRQVAAVMSRLEDHQSRSIPWHRVVGSSGKLGNFAGAEVQAQRLAAEGVAVSPARRILDFAAVYIAPGELDSGVPRGQRRPGSGGSSRRRQTPAVRRG